MLSVFVIHEDGSHSFLIFYGLGYCHTFFFFYLLHGTTRTRENFSNRANYFVLDMGDF